jgi:hypothetical protein
VQQTHRLRVDSGLHSGLRQQVWPTNCSRACMCAEMQVSGGFSILLTYWYAD